MASKIMTSSNTSSSPPSASNVGDVEDIMNVSSHKQVSASSCHDESMQPVLRALSDEENGEEDLTEDEDNGVEDNDQLATPSGAASGTKPAGQVMLNRRLRAALSKQVSIYINT